MTIYSVVNSLTELKEINKVKFLIEGKSSPDFKEISDLIPNFQEVPADKQ